MTDPIAPKFGTSGLRGLVTELTPELIAVYVRAFLVACPIGSGLFVARDLRASSGAIAATLIETAMAEGVMVTDCGEVPTPALALASMAAGAAAIMITGSHIPADRNGLKFYTPAGEITKAEETAILAAVERRATRSPSGARGMLEPCWPSLPFLGRYRDAFGVTALAGQRIGVWSHSAVGRDLLIETLREIGADVVELARSHSFIPVDTEAVEADVRQFLRNQAATYELDAIVSTDGDGDRPLVTDARGEVVPGDVLGQITARFLGADVVVTPVSSNTGVEALGLRVIRTKIGSPFVIAGMEAELQARPSARVVGYEVSGQPTPWVTGFRERVMLPAS